MGERDGLNPFDRRLNWQEKVAKGEQPWCVNMVGVRCVDVTTCRRWCVLSPLTRPNPGGCDG